MDPKTLVTVVGDLPHAVKGQQLRFVGDWMLHPKHSWQLKATAYEEVVPQSPQAVAAYLASTIEGEGFRVICLLKHSGLPSPKEDCCLLKSRQNGKGLSKKTG